jgi:hypothetical protein
MKLVGILAVVCGLMVLTAIISPVCAQQAPPPSQQDPAQPTPQPDQLTPASPQHPAQQPAQPDGSVSPNQWVSHQMNQPPPPPASERHKISQERIDELQQLYELAKKEQENKAKKQGSMK